MYFLNLKFFYIIFFSSIKCLIKKLFALPIKKKVSSALKTSYPHLRNMYHQPFLTIFTGKHMQHVREQCTLTKPPSNIHPTKLKTSPMKSTTLFTQSISCNCFWKSLGTTFLTHSNNDNMKKNIEMSFPRLFCFCNH